MRRPILTATLLTVLALPARAEPPNLSANPEGEPGAAAQLVLAQRTYQAALKSGDPVLLVTAIRLAREVVLRPPTGWTRMTEGEPPLPDDEDALANDPAGPKAIAIAQSLAGEDPALQDLVYDLDAQVPHGRRPVAIIATSTLAGGQTDSWRIVLAGETPAEIGLLGEGVPIGLHIRDEAGTLVCAYPAATGPVLCRFTPAANGFFTVEVTNAGSDAASYRLVGN